jgi:hypothetical protein
MINHYYIQNSGDNLINLQLLFNNRTNLAIKNVNELNKEQFNGDSILVILCELDWDEIGQHRNYCEFYGIELAKKYLRSKLRVKNPILFISAVPHYVLENPKYNIIRCVGHDFLSFEDYGTEKWERTIENLKPLTDLQLLDIINNYCDIKNIIGDIFHKYRGSIATSLRESEDKRWESLKRILTECLNEVIRLLGNSQESQERKLKVMTEFNNDKMIKKQESGFEEWFSSKANDFSSLIPEENNGKVEEPDREYEWKVLFLDDEPDSIKGIVDSFPKNLEIIQATTVEQAEYIIEQDKYNKINVIIADYRLYDFTDEVHRHQSKQGYDFLFELSKKNRLNSLIALSGLGRKQLLESFLKYNTKVAVFAKNDLSNEQSIKLFVDYVIDSGDAIELAIINHPTSPQWISYNKNKVQFCTFYSNFRNRHDYNVIEARISLKASEYIRRIESLFRKRVFKNDGDISDFIIGDFPTLKNLGGHFDDLIDKKYWDYFENKMTARRVAIWCILIKGMELKQVYNVLSTNSLLNLKKSSESSYKTLINSELALKIEDVPLFILAEEKNWFREIGYDIEKIDNLLVGTDGIIDALNLYLNKNENIRDKIIYNIKSQDSNKSKSSLEKEDILGPDKIFLPDKNLNIIGFEEAKWLINRIMGILDGKSLKDFCDVLTKIYTVISEYFDSLQNKSFKKMETLITKIYSEELRKELELEYQKLEIEFQSHPKYLEDLNTIIQKKISDIK